MIESVCELIGEVDTDYEELTGEASIQTIEIQPVLQEKEVNPTKEGQIVMPDEGYNGLSQVTVNPIVTNYQEKEITPTKEEQVTIPDEGYDGLSKVTVKPIPDNYIEMSGSIYNTEDATVTEADLTEGKIAYGANGKIIGTAPNYWDLTKRSSGRIVQYLINLPIFDTSDYTSFNDFFSYFAGESLPMIDTSNGTSFTNFAMGCINLIEFPQYDFSKGKTFGSCFPGSTAAKLEKIPLLDFGVANSISGMISTVPALTDVGGFKDLGKGFSKSSAANYYAYTLSLSNAYVLTEQSIINILDNLYDIATMGCNVQKCTLGSKNIAKLTSAEGQAALANATAKGWTIS